MTVQAPGEYNRGAVRGGKGQGWRGWRAGSHTDATFEATVVGTGAAGGCNSDGRGEERPAGTGGHWRDAEGDQQRRQTGSARLDEGLWWAGIAGGRASSLEQKSSFHVLFPSAFGHT